jgi:hypothetical protein
MESERASDRCALPPNVMGSGYRKVTVGVQAHTGLILSVECQSLLRMQIRSGVFG